MKILGIDPGSRVTGYGLIEVKNQSSQLIEAGLVEVAKYPMAERLSRIFQAIEGIVQTHQPEHVAIERVFVSKNVDSALKLGQARGAALVAAANDQCAIYEYSARQIKQAVVGTGSASKAQVQHMIRILLNLTQAPKADAADALAVALCHSHSWQHQRRLMGSFD